MSYENPTIITESYAANKNHKRRRKMFKRVRKRGIIGGVPWAISMERLRRQERESNK